MKFLLYFLGLLACTIWASSRASESSQPDKVVLPDLVKLAVPVNMEAIFFTSSGHDALIVMQSKEASSGDSPSKPNVRTIVLFRKNGSSYREAARSSKIIACSTCGREAIDPFIAEGIALKNGKLVIEQDYSAEPSTAIYKFAYNKSSNEWMVTSAIHTDVEQNPVAASFFKTRHVIKLPMPPLFINFDPGWRPREPGVAVVIDQAGTFSFLHADSWSELESKERISCSDGAACREIRSQMNGCISLSKNEKNQYFIGTSKQLKNEGHKEASDLAISNCKSAGATSCEEVRTDCALSFLKSSTNKGD